MLEVRKAHGQESIDRGYHFSGAGVKDDGGAAKNWASSGTLEAVACRDAIVLEGRLRRWVTLGVSRNKCYNLSHVTPSPGAARRPLPQGGEGTKVKSTLPSPPLGERGWG